ncbi:MAG: tetratricopeptide repeat protein, partial [Pyrinomonadaceae bacterium]
MFYKTSLFQPSRNCLSAIISIFVPFLAFSVFAQTQLPEPQKAPPPIPLELNKPYNGQIDGTQKQRFQLAMEEGQFASFHAQSPNVKLGIMEINSDGAEVLLYGGFGMALDEKFVVVAEKSGTYQFEIFTPQKAHEGQYTFAMTELRAATVDEKGLQLALDLYTKGASLDLEGKFTEAEAFFDRALEIQKRIAGPDSYQVAKTLSYISSTHSNRGDYVTAIDLETKALKIQEKIYSKDDPRIAQSNYEIGMMVINKGDTANAERYFLESLDILKRGNHVDSVVGYLDYLMLGDVSYSLGDLQKANELLKQSLVVSEKLFGPDHYHLADVLLEIGRVELESGDASAAEAAAKRALANTEKQYGSEHWRDVFPLNDLGRIYSTSGDLAKAEHVYERAFAINEKVLEAGGLHVNETLAGLVRVYAAQGMMSKALTYQTRVSENEERLIGMNLVGGSEREKLAFLSTLSPLISQNVSLHIQTAPDAPAFRDLAMTTILRRKGRIQDFLAYGNEAALARLSPDDRNLAMQFNDVTAKLSSLVLHGPENLSVGDYRKKVKELEDTREQFESEISRRNIRTLPRSTSLTLDDVKKHIPDNAA